MKVILKFVREIFKFKSKPSQIDIISGSADRLKSFCKHTDCRGNKVLSNKMTSNGNDQRNTKEIVKGILVPSSNSSTPITISTSSSGDPSQQINISYTQISFSSNLVPELKIDVKKAKLKSSTIRLSRNEHSFIFFHCSSIFEN